MTITTFLFKQHKKEGKIKVLGKALVKDGTRRFVRTLYFDTTYNEKIVLINGNAYTFKQFNYCLPDGTITGRI